MAAIITEEISEQGFEKVLYQVAAILFTELDNQKTVHSNMPDFAVFTERMTPYAQAENVMINVTSSNINFGNFTQSTSQGKVDFSIEIYSPLEHTSIDAGDDSKKFTLHKVAGLIRYILSSTKYKTLNLPLGLIGGTYVESIQFFDDFNNHGGASIRMATLGFSVRVQENQDLWNGVSFNENNTSIKLEETNLGYQLIKIN